jgi:hypothetical protein
MNAKQRLILLVKQARLTKLSAGAQKPNNNKFSAPPVKPTAQAKPNTGVIPAPLAPNVGNGPGAVKLPLAPPKQPGSGPGFELLDKPLPEKSTKPAPAPTPTPPSGLGSFDLLSLFAPVQQKIEELGVQGAAPYMGMLHPIFNAAGSIAGPAGTSALTDFLFHGGKNIATLTSGLNNRSGNMAKDVAPNSAAGPAS